MSFKIRLVMFGRTRNTEIRAFLDDYAQRIRRYAEFEAAELREGDKSALRKLKLAPGSQTVLLDASGKEFTSGEFATWMGKLRDQGVRELVFFCGGAEGFPEPVKKSAQFRISLSRLTMPHELARVVLAEQVYRAFTILTGHPYPK